MTRQEETLDASAIEAGEKHLSPVSHEDLEANDDKATQATTGLSYTNQGTQEERSLIFKQDLRIIPLSSGIYLLCYLDRSNIGNAKVCLSTRIRTCELYVHPTDTLQGPQPR